MINFFAPVSQTNLLCLHTSPKDWSIKTLQRNTGSDLLNGLVCLIDLWDKRLYIRDLGAGNRNR